ncbi:MAG: hypothetical protein O7C56_04730 [Rickettsia endosymbiont of Ixodes persulcatus]|nr:hypothetical protein [Rickettsia endosymbiont of Ixodes persulcatus]
MVKKIAMERWRKEGLVERDERDARELAEEWRERAEEESGRRGKGNGQSVELRRSEQPERRTEGVESSAEGGRSIAGNSNKPARRPGVKRSALAFSQEGN